MGVSAHHRDEYIRMNCNIVAATAQNINPRGLYQVFVMKGIPDSLILQLRQLVPQALKPR
jgi:hypothetical protein